MAPIPGNGREKRILRAFKTVVKIFCVQLKFIARSAVFKAIQIRHSSVHTSTTMPGVINVFRETVVELALCVNASDDWCAKFMEFHC